MATGNWAAFREVDRDTAAMSCVPSVLSRESSAVSFFELALPSGS